ncbi:MAG: hypothetical protein WC356_02205 [Candidatus Micrarchaeia archaeon]|jgi:hypothetical protein
MTIEEQLKTGQNKSLEDRRREDEIAHGIDSFSDKLLGIRRYGGDGPARFHRMIMI